MNDQLPELLGNITIKGETYSMVFKRTSHNWNKWNCGNENDYWAERFLVDPSGVPCGWINLHRCIIDGVAIHIICDIEIRPTHQGNKLGMKWLRALEDQGVYRQYATGTCTEAGFHGIVKHLEIMDRKNLSHFLRPMTFIHNWDEMITNV